MTNPQRPASLDRCAIELLERALDVDESKRTTWIDAECAGDRVLRRRVLELLAAADPSDDAFAGTHAVVEGIVGAVPGGSGLARGDRLGAYSIEREMNRGGMGVVYLAHRADEAFELRVAIKTIAVAGRPVLAGRFESERRILARLRHPNIVGILDGGTAPDGSPYLVMEHIEGEPLDVYCDRRRLSIDERLELFLQVCDGVDHAHRNLVVHRDLKPDNILVTAEGEVKLLDFGIAKLLAVDGQADRSAATLLGGQPLTPEYASPEQIRHEPATTSGDIYSLGVVLYELLTGKRPYELPDRTPQTMLRVVCDTAAPAPSRMVGREGSQHAAEARATTLAKLARRLAGDLDNIVLTALRKEGERRYHSASALAEDIRSHLRGEPVRARPLTLAYLTGRFVLRYRVQVVAAVLVFCSLVAGGVATLWQSVRATRAAERAASEATRTQKMNDFLESLLTTPDPIRGLSPDATLADLTDYALARLDKDFADDPGDRGSLRRTLAGTYLNLGRFDTAREQLELALAENREAYGDKHIETIKTERFRAVYDDMIGDPEAALDDIETVVQALEDLPGHPRELGLAYELYGGTLSNLGRNEEALHYFDSSIALLEGVDGSAYDVVQALNNKAVVLMNDGEFARAVETLEEGLNRSRSVQDDPYPLQARMHANLGLTYKELGRPDDARRHLTSAAKLLTELLGAEHPETLLARIALCEQLLVAAADLPAADREMAAVLEAATRSLPPEHFIIPYAQTVRAKVLIALGEGQAAETHIRNAIRIRRDILPEGHWLIASAELTLGRSLLQQGKRDQARAVLLSAYRVLEQERGADFSKTVEARSLLVDLGVELPSD